MLEAVDLRQKLDKASYKERMEELALQLRALQLACWEEQRRVVVVLEGWAAAGKGAIVKDFVRNMDPRGCRVHPIWPPSELEMRYPFLWRFWKKMPAAGNIGIFYHSWYTRLLEDRLFNRIDESDVPAAIRHINAFERQLSDDGVAIAKFWIHLSRKELKQRLKTYANDPLEAWRVRKEDWQQAKHYDRYTELAEEMLVSTSTGPAPWTIVEGNCTRWATVKVLTTGSICLREAIDRHHLTQQSPVPNLPPQKKLEAIEPNFLAKVDLSQTLTKEDYQQLLRQAQIKLRTLQQAIDKHQVPVLILFEGWDAAGKGGAIKRLTDILDPRSFRVQPFAAPTEEELGHHYLWRFWRQLPEAGHIGIFDRSWYGRVLVERVEGFASDMEWRRAYREIQEFEAQLIDAGYVLVKFWLHISPEEQLQRFRDRESDPLKQYKLTEEDWRNRDKQSLYEVAVNQMILRTSMPDSPWTLVAGNDKRHARVKIIETVVDAIEKRLPK